MFHTIHTLFGIFLSTLDINLWIIIIIAFFSHWVLDFIPHFGYKTRFDKKSFIRIAVIDGLVSLVLLFSYLIIENPSNFVFVLFIVFLTTYVDLFRIPDLFFNKRYFKKIFFDFHKKIQNEFREGWIIEIVVFTVLFYLLFINT